MHPAMRQTLRLANKYFHDLIKPAYVNFVEFGAEHGFLKFCKVGLNRGEPRRVVCSLAASRGHLEILKWAHSNGCPWDRWTCMNASENGHLEVLEWAISQKCPWDEWTCYYAAENNHLNILEWAHSNGCPWDEWTCVSAAENGHLEVLMWAIENGCPWNYQKANISSYPPRIQKYLKSLRG